MYDLGKDSRYRLSSTVSYVNMNAGTRFRSLAITETN